MTAGEEKDQTARQPGRAAQAPGWQQRGGGQPPYQLPYQQYWPPALGPPRHPDALTAIALGAASIMGLAFLGPFAWYIGAKAGREMTAQPGRWSGDDLARIGTILGMIGTALCVLFVLFLVFAIIVGLGALAGFFAVLTAMGS